MKRESPGAKKIKTHYSLVISQIWKAVHSQSHHDVASSRYLMALWGKGQPLVDEPGSNKAHGKANSDDVANAHHFRINDTFHYGSTWKKK